MKTYAYIITATVASLTLLGASAARADSFELKAHVPFEFTAGTTTFAAGPQTVVRREGSQGVLLIRGPNKSIMLLAGPEERGVKGTPARLVFHRQGRRYFLREVWSVSTSGYALPETREEREAKAKTSDMASASGVVTVVAMVN